MDDTKTNARKALDMILSEEEASDVLGFDLLQKLRQDIQSFKEEQQKTNDEFAQAVLAVVGLVKDQQSATSRLSTDTKEAFEAFGQAIVQKLDSLQKSDGGWNKNAAPLFRQLIAEVSQVKESSKKSVEVQSNWKFPQYSSVSVRNRSFANINPKTDGIGLGSYDYVSLSQTATNDTYTFKMGGASGTLVATVSIEYTSSAKTVISTVTKTPITVQ